MILGETASWEESQRLLIAKDSNFLHSFQILKYVNVALLTLLLYDHCLTFDLEKTRIWSLRWGLPKILFMINRYFLPPIYFFDGLTNVVHVGQTFEFQRFSVDYSPGYNYRCDVRIFTPIPAFPAIMTVELMLIIRVLALYDNSKRMAWYLIIQTLVQMLALLITAILVLPNTKSITGREVFTGCLSDIPDWAYLAWLQPLIVEIILVVLVVYKCRVYGSFSPTVKILARDSIVYFMTCTVMLVFNLFYARDHKLLGMALTLPTSILASIAAARLSINIRSITMERAMLTLVTQSRLVPTLVFRGPESINYGTRRATFSNITEQPEAEGISQQDGDGDQLLELEELRFTTAITAPSTLNL